jgi:hypothetical protein
MILLWLVMALAVRLAVNLAVALLLFLMAFWAKPHQQSEPSSNEIGGAATTSTRAT